MRIDIITLFPEMFTAFCQFGVIGRAIQKKIIHIHFISPRQFAPLPHRIVDDKPYGGGAGMVMMAQPIIDSIDFIEKHNPKATRIYLTPRGQLLNDKRAQSLSQESGIVILCGRYRGIDERAVEYFSGTEISIGDYILSGGEIAAMAVIDSLSRYIPSVLGNTDSLQEESLVDGLLDPPCYTRPATILNQKVPSILLQGNHADIAQWRFETQKDITAKKRPDLLFKK